MNLLQKAIGYFTRDLSIQDPAGWNPEGQRSHAGERVNQESALALSAVWACVNLLAGTIASLPVQVFAPSKSGSPVPKTDHPLYRLLHDSPNADQTALDFWEFVSASLELRGNAYARIEKIGARIVSLVPIRPDIVCVRRLSDGSFRYSWTDFGVSNAVGSDEMFHIRGFGGAPGGGMSTLSYARQTLGLATAIEKQAGAMFQNGVRPTGIFKVKDPMKPEQRQVTEQLLQEKFTGAMNAGRPMLLDNGAEWVTLTITPEDAQMLQSRGFSIEEICRFFGVPPIMVGHGEKTSSWGTGVQEVTLGFVKYTLRRRLKRIEQAIAKQLLTPQDRAAGITVAFNLEALLRGDSAARATFYQVMTQIGAMTINEVRALEGLPPIEGGDVPRMQMQNQPITDAPGIGHNGGPPLKDAA